MIKLNKNNKKLLCKNVKIIFTKEINICEKKHEMKIEEDICINVRIMQVNNPIYFNL